MTGGSLTIGVGISEVKRGAKRFAASKWGVALDYDLGGRALRTSRILASLVIVAAVAFVYRAALSAYFFDDDFQWLAGTLTFTPARLIDVSHMGHFYRPIVDLFFTIGARFFGGSPTLLHLAILILHAANGLLLMALARTIMGSPTFGFLTALFFVVQPADVGAVAWVGALAEPTGAFFGCLAILWFLAFRENGSRALQILSAASFGLALLTHESSVVFVVLLALADWAFVDPSDRGAPRRQLRLESYWLHGLLLVAYLAVDLQINSRNYVVTEGHYTIGPHVITNTLEYIVALYVGRHDIANYLIVIGVIGWTLLGKNRRATFASLWLLLALAPFVFFTWSNTSRYEYLPAMGFSMLLAEGVIGLGRVIGRRLSSSAAAVAVVVLAAAITIRFALFAAGNVEDYAAEAEDYRRYISAFRSMHGEVASRTQNLVGPPTTRPHNHAFLNALVQWEYRDPTIQLAPEAPLQ